MLNSGLSAFHARDAARRLSSFQPNDIEDTQSTLVPESGGPQKSENALSLDDYPAWGQTLAIGGYDTYICGKWHQDDVMMQRSFKEMGPVAPGMYRSTSIQGSAYRRPPLHGSDPWDPADRTLNGHWVHTGLIDNSRHDAVEHNCKLFTDHCIDYLENKAAKRNAPFFMYVGWNEPHDPRQAPQEFLDLYPPDKIEVPPNFLPEHPFNEGDHFVRDEQLAPFPRSRHAVQVHRREYYAIISYMDQQIGRIVAALEKSGKARNTYVIMTADHGLAVGEHGLLGKQNLYDCSVRIPLIVAGPGIPAGKRVDAMVYQHSMFATTCELSGIKTPAHVEFPSLAPLLKAGGGAGNDAIFGYYKHFQRMVRTRTHKLIVYPHIRRLQLFDLQKDPWEMHDLSEDGALASVKADLIQRLKKLQHELGDDVELRV
jgi:choline-sulfatase